MRQTQKLIAAQAQCKRLGLLFDSEYRDSVFEALEYAGYKWENGEWIQRPGIVADFKSGIVDIRLRVANGELEDVVERVKESLLDNGFEIIQTSKPYPDDRHGPATTSRVYIQVKV